MTKSPANSPVCVVAGVGPGNGAALVRKFAAAGYSVAMLARTKATTAALSAENRNTHPFTVDLTQAEAVKQAFADIAAALGPVDTLVYNAGNSAWGSALDVSESDFENAWRLNAAGAFHAVRCVLPGMIPKGAGQIVFIGATASLRGGPRTAAFAPAKAAQRSLAQSLAKAYGPLGVHVSLVIVDGVVDEPARRAEMPDRPDTFFLKPDDVAATAYELTRQSRSAWTFEIDLRPFGETW